MLLFGKNRTKVKGSNVRKVIFFCTPTPQLPRSSSLSVEFRLNINYKNTVLTLLLEDLFLDLPASGKLQLVDQKTRFHLRDGVTSLSHTDKYIAFAALANNTRGQIGVDIEPTERVHADVIERIKKKSERTPPWEAALWCAKESTWKALRGERQPKVISQVEIGEWKTLESGTLLNAHQFQYLESEEYGFSKSCGVAFQFKHLTISVFVGLF